MGEYTKFTGKISPQDSHYINYPRGTSPNVMQKKCDEQSSCMGYYAGGQSALLYELHAAGNWAPSNDGTSLYIKNPPDLPKYKFEQNREVGDNITYMDKTPLKEIATACDADPNCKAFSSRGWLKRKSSPTYFVGNRAEKSLGLYVKDSKKYCESTGDFDTDPICVNLCTEDPSWCRLTKRSICQKKGLKGIDDPMCKTLCSKDNNKDICDPIYQEYCSLTGNKDKALCACFKNEMPAPGTVCLDPICIGAQSYKTKAFVDRDCPKCAQYLNNLGTSSYVQGTQTMVCNALGTNLVPETESRTDKYPAELPKFADNDTINSPSGSLTKEQQKILTPEKGTNWALIGAGGLLFLIILITLIWQLTKK